jgi:MFS family permease
LENNKIYRLLIVIITTLSSFNTGFMGSAINIALPVIGMEFNASAISVSWISTAFLLTTAITLLPFGKFSDIYGRAKFFKLGVMIFAVSSLVCGLSSNTVLMIAFRSLQGVGS